MLFSCLHPDLRFPPPQLGSSLLASETVDDSAPKSNSTWVFLDPSSTRGWILQGADYESEISITRWIGYSRDHTSGGEGRKQIGPREKLGCDVVTTESPGDPTGRSVDG